MFKKTALFIAASATTLALSASLTQAATVTILTNENQVYSTVHGVRDNTASSGGDMVGTILTATYTDGTSEELVIEQGNRSFRGVANGTGMSLFKAWGDFRLTATNTLASLFFQLAPSGSIFDMSTALDGQPGDTPTTKVGYPFEITGGADGYSGNVAATYSGALRLASATDPAGDAFINMMLDFTDLAGGGYLGELTFRTDIDTLRYKDDLAAVPLPASLPLLLAGLGAFGLARRRKATTA